MQLLAIWFRLNGVEEIFPIRNHAHILPFPSVAVLGFKVKYLLMKIFWLFNHPAPYKVDLFNELGKQTDFFAVFERDSEGDRNPLFYDREATKFKAHFCKSIKLGVLNSYTDEPVKLLKQDQYDIVVLNGWRMIGERKAIRYCKKHSVPYVFAINGGIVPKKENPLIAKIKTKYISGASSYLCPDEKSKGYLTHYGADESKIHLFPYSTVHEDEMLLNPYSEQQKRTLQEKYRINCRRMFISVGQLIERKNYGQLIRLWKDMPKEDALLILGDGPLNEELQNQIKSEGLNNIYLFGQVDHAKSLEMMRMADAFVLLSKEDIYGHVINEAMSQGIPVIAPTTMNAACHLIEDGKNGFLVSLDDEAGIMKALQSDFDESMCQAALDVARQNTIEESAAWHMHFFKQYLEAEK